jgi:2-polyprenyl-3-methyl-5-hydroxy-6-metoxy-1,4-benzoquinol methylase
MFNKHKRYDYHQCGNCNLVFQFPPPTTEEISDFYPDTYEIYEEQSRLKKISTIRKSTLKRYYGYSHLATSTLADNLCFISNLFSRNFEIPFVKNGQVLDVGCGNGRYLDGMKKLGWNVKGVEFNASAVAVCKLSELDVHHGDLISAKLPENTFDVINVSHVIEHVPNPKEFFAELARVLKKNGLLIIKTPNSEALGRAWLGTNWFPNEVPRHLFLFSIKNLTALANSFDLKTNLVATRSTPKFILNSIDYVLQNQGKPSKKIAWKRWLAKTYVLIAKVKRRGDEILIVFTNK